MNIANYNFRMFFEGGQSNLAGFVDGVDLPLDLRGPIKGARMFYGNGFGTNWAAYNFQTLQYNVNNDGTQGLNTQFRDHYGMELRLMKLFVNRYGPGFDMLKCAEGGTSLGKRNLEGRRDWSPLSTGEMLDVSDGYELRGKQVSGGKPPAFYIWGQGEDDANSVNYGYGPMAANYETELTQLIAHKRSILNAPEMIFIILRLGNLQTKLPTTERNIIRTAQQNVCANVPNCYLVSQDGLAVREDDGIGGLHFTAASQDTIAYRTFNVMRQHMPFMVYRSIFAVNDGTFADAGITAENTDEIFLADGTVKSFKPNRPANLINSFVTGKSYFARMYDNVNLSNYSYNN